MFALHLALYLIVAVFARGYEGIILAGKTFGGKIQVKTIQAFFLGLQKQLPSFFTSDIQDQSEQLLENAKKLSSVIVLQLKVLCQLALIFLQKKKKT